MGVQAYSNHDWSHRKVPYFLEYSPGLKLTPVWNWTRVNLAIQIEKF